MSKEIHPGYTRGEQQPFHHGIVSVSLIKAIITLILATDMARHGEILDSFKQKVDNFDFTNEEHVTCVCIHYVPIQFPISPFFTSHWPMELSDKG